MSNIDIKVVEDFGNEWNEYNQQKINQSKLNLKLLKIIFLFF